MGDERICRNCKHYIEEEAYSANAYCEVRDWEVPGDRDDGCPYYRAVTEEVVEKHLAFPPCEECGKNLDGIALWGLYCSDCAKSLGLEGEVSEWYSPEKIWQL